jgi:hypothetical protein
MFEYRSRSTSENAATKPSVRLASPSSLSLFRNPHLTRQHLRALTSRLGTTRRPRRAHPLNKEYLYNLAESVRELPGSEDGYLFELEAAVRKLDEREAEEKGLTTEEDLRDP